MLKKDKNARLSAL